MGKWKNAVKAGGGVQRDTSPIPSFHGGKPEDTTHDLLEEVLSQTGASPRAPFRFTPSSRLPSIWSLSPEGRRACSMTPENWMHYCIHVKSDSRGGNQPLPSHTWSGLLIADMFQDGLEEQITEAVIDSSDRGSDQSLEYSTVTRTSDSSHGSAHLGRDPWMKVNLPIFKDEKTKDALTYQCWWWDMAIFHQSGWDDQIWCHTFSTCHKDFWVTWLGV